jgi:hypothetical protein
MTGALMHICSYHCPYKFRIIEVITFSPDSRLIAAASWEPRGDDDDSVDDYDDDELFSSYPRGSEIPIWETESGKEIIVLQATSRVKRMSFGPGGTRLQTGCETLSLLPSCGSQETMSLSHSPSLSAVDDEVRYKGKCIMHLPSEYSTPSVTGRKGLLPLAQTSGRITFMEFDEEGLEALARLQTK